MTRSVPQSKFKDGDIVWIRQGMTQKDWKEMSIIEHVAQYELSSQPLTVVESYRFATEEGIERVTVRAALGKWWLFAHHLTREPPPIPMEDTRDYLAVVAS